MHCELYIMHANYLTIIPVMWSLFATLDDSPLAGSFPDRHCFPCRVSIQAPQGKKRYLTFESTYTSMATNFRICDDRYTPGVFPHKDLPPQHRRERPGCVNWTYVCNEYHNSWSVEILKFQLLFCQVCLPIVSAENWKPATKTDQVDNRKKPSKKLTRWTIEIRDYLFLPGDPGSGGPRERPWTWASPEGRPGR